MNLLFKTGTQVYEKYMSVNCMYTIVVYFSSRMLACDWQFCRQIYLL